MWNLNNRGKAAKLKTPNCTFALLKYLMLGSEIGLQAILLHSPYALVLIHTS